MVVMVGLCVGVGIVVEGVEVAHETARTVEMRNKVLKSFILAYFKAMPSCLFQSY